MVYNSWSVLWCECLWIVRSERCNVCYSQFLYWLTRGQYSWCSYKRQLKIIKHTMKRRAYHIFWIIINLKWKSWLTACDYCEFKDLKSTRLTGEADVCIYPRMVINKARNIEIWWKSQEHSCSWQYHDISWKGITVVGVPGSPAPLGSAHGGSAAPGPHLGHRQGVVGDPRNCPWKLCGADVNDPSFLEFHTKTLHWTISVFCRQYTKLSNISDSIFCSNSIS